MNANTTREPETCTETKECGCEIEYVRYDRLSSGQYWKPCAIHSLGMDLLTGARTFRPEG